MAAAWLRFLPLSEVRSPGNKLGQLFQSSLIFLVKGIHFGTVDVDNRHDLLVKLAIISVYIFGHLM